MPAKSHTEPSAIKQLRINYARSLKQIRSDYRDLMERLPQVGRAVFGAEAFMRELGEKIVNPLISIESDAKKLGKDTHTLPSFIKRKDVWVLCKNSTSLLVKLSENEAWLRRLTGADSKHGREEDREAFLKRVNKFKKTLKELMKDTNEYELFLPFIEKFEQGTLGAFNDYTKQLRIAEKVTPHLLKGFCEQEHKGSLQIQQAGVLTQVLMKLNSISENIVAQEELKFKRTKEYKEKASPFEQKILLKKHMAPFQETLPLQEKIAFLDRVLESQQPFKKRKLTKEEKATLTKDEKAKITQEEKEKMAQRKADKKEFAPLFKRDTKAEKNGEAINIIQQLKELRAALVVTEDARIGYLEVVRKASQPETHTRERRIDSAKSSSATVETTNSHKKEKTEAGKYARKMRLFQEVEQAPLLEKTVGMEIDAAEENQVASSPFTNAQ